MKCRRQNIEPIALLILAAAAATACLATSTTAVAQLVDDGADFQSAVTARYDALIPATNSWARFTNARALEPQRPQQLFAGLALSADETLPASARQYHFGETNAAAAYHTQVAPTIIDPLQALLPPMPMPGGVEVRKVAFSDGLEIKLGLDLEPGRLGTRLMP